MQNDRHMVLWALDENRNSVHANNAELKKKYYCPECGISLHVTHRSGKKFFACYPKNPHAGENCKKGKRIHRDPAHTNPDAFFGGLLKPDKDGPFTGGSGPAKGPIEGVFSCTSLEHFYKAGFQIHPPRDGLVGEHKLEEFMITSYNASSIMSDNAPLSCRMVFAEPDGYDNEQNALRFVVVAGGTIPQKKVFLLIFDKAHDKDYKTLRYKLFFASDSSSVAKVLIAADWIDASSPMCGMVCTKKCPDHKWECTGMQVGHYVSKRQIYIPKPKKKPK